ncbi:DUF6292 family protein [Spirillospora sp. NPDC046719]
MSVTTTLAHHEDPEVDAAHGYVATVMDALAAQGIALGPSHLDPKGPVDATIRSGDRALVWDEWHGWRIGGYVSGRPGERTVLKDAVELGGGVLLRPAELADLVRRSATLPPVTREPGARDGLFDALREY